MKQIFDWLREQIKDREITADFRTKEMIKNKDADGFEIQAGKLMAFLETLTLINEAEAKWEKDCCIRVVGKPFTSSCGQKWDKWTDVGEPYCSKCGKRTKIVEVE